MIKKIISLQESFYHTTDDRFAILAKYIMEEIEEAGMLPPLRPVHPMDGCWDRAICAEMDGMDVKVALWEREVEGKPAKKKGSAKTSRSGIKKAKQ
jgi:hypothetical protein